MDNSMTGRQIVLVVDDQPTNIDVLLGVLQPDYRVKVALDGKQALALAAAEPPPDLILLDIMMPEMDGYEVCRRLKTNPFTRNIPIIFVTAMSDVVDESRGFELGAVDYITKPVSPPLVKARVRTHLALYEQNCSLEEMVRQRTSDLQRANQQLTQERARFEWMVQTANDGYLMLDKSGFLVFANPQARVYLGILPDRPLPSVRFIELVRRQYRPETREAWEAPLTQADAPPRYLVRPETTTARDFWLQADILEMSGDASSREKSIVVRLRDVTEQVGSRRDRSAFTLMVHHKMRTPLGTLISSLDLLAQHADEMPQDEIVLAADYSLKGALRLQATIEDVLSYLDAAGQVRSGDFVALAQLVSLAVGIGEDLGIKHISVECASELRSLNLFFSQRAMELALWELLENARKFHPQKSPSVLIRVDKVRDQMIRIQVCDDGLTLSPEQLAKAWVPFYQGEKYFTGELPGTGLGLPLVNTLVISVGGSSHIYNREDGPGVIVELLLPMASTTENAGDGKRPSVGNS
jgi:CheY-like chemotaxis protein/anti-sigma regulatory factor (Ser/Thr protein kinase)